MSRLWQATGPRTLPIAKGKGVFYNDLIEVDYDHSGSWESEHGSVREGANLQGVK